MILCKVSIKNKIKFSNEKDCNDFEERFELRGIFQYNQVINFLESKGKEITYETFSGVFKRDKSLRDKLYIFFAAFEEILRNKLFSSYNIKTIVNNGIRSLESYKRSDPYKIVKIENYNLYYSLKCPLGVLINILEHHKLYDKNQINDLRTLLLIRNDVMHHNMLLLNNYTTFDEVNKYVNNELKNKLFLIEQFIPQTMFNKIKDIYLSRVDRLLK